jgi:hypothetical protein
MIERCNFCGKEHDTGDGENFLGMVIKVCPSHPTNPPMTMISRNNRGQILDVVRYGGNLAFESDLDKANFL